MSIRKDDRERTTDVDVVVIGGGVNGTGLARDLTLRGLRVALFEKHDLAFGASGNSSGMIHGGPRYLLSHPKVTQQSCKDSGFIQAVAPHLLFRIPFLMPILRKGLARRIYFDLMDAFFGAYDDYVPLKRGKPHTRLDGDELLQLEPGLVGDFIGGVTFDEWGIDGARLCTLNAIDAEERGAELHTHCEIVELIMRRDGDRRVVEGVRARDTRTGAIVNRTAKIVVNASGAWGPLFANIAGVPLRLRPGKGIHIVFDRRLTNYAIAANAIDGRQVFLEPWQSVSVLGTTDDDYYGDLDDVRATGDEVRYLVQAIAQIFPAIRGARAVGVYTGVRPTLWGWGGIEDRLSREHEIVDHARGDRGGVAGLYSLIGGKLASYRLFAEEAADVVARELGVERACETHRLALPGGADVPDALVIANHHDFTPIGARRLVYRHGSRADRVLERVARAPAEARVVCACEPVTEAEVRHVVQHEHAVTVDDVSRRTRLGLGPCGGMRCALRCGQIVAQETGATQRQGEAQAIRFLDRQRRLRAPALGPDQARQEALAIAALRAQTSR
ncbi:MAG: glycerol-3-phosphate dehydrogenase/oxidase [Polyangiales bacterium]